MVLTWQEVNNTGHFLLACRLCAWCWPKVSKECWCNNLLQQHWVKDEYDNCMLDGRKRCKRSIWSNRDDYLGSLERKRLHWWGKYFIGAEWWEESWSDDPFSQGNVLQMEQSSTSCSEANGTSHAERIVEIKLWWLYRRANSMDQRRRCSNYDEKQKGASQVSKNSKPGVPEEMTQKKFKVQIFQPSIIHIFN